MFLLPSVSASVYLERSFVVLHASEVRALENRVYRWSVRWPRSRGLVGACSRLLRVVGSLLGVAAVVKGEPPWCSYSIVARQEASTQYFTGVLRRFSAILAL